MSKLRETEDLLEAVEAEKESAEAQVRCEITYILMGRYNHSLSLVATIMISKYWLTIGEPVATIFVTQ